MENIPSGNEGKKRSPLALPLEEYDRLTPEQMQEAADVAGVTPDRLRELLLKAASTKKDVEMAGQAKRAEMDAKRDANSRDQNETASGREYNTWEVRQQLENMKQSTSNLDLADTMEKNAYESFEKYPETTYSFDLFYRAEKIRAREKMWSLRVDRTLDEIIALTRKELKEKASRSNIPYLRDALDRVAKELPNEFKIARKHVTETLDSYGSAEKFSANAVSGYVKNPRPRRYGDELDHG